jgi:hypothetical protein
MLTRCKLVNSSRRSRDCCPFIFRIRRFDPDDDDDDDDDNYAAAADDDDGITIL